MIRTKRIGGEALKILKKSAASEKSFTMMKNRCSGISIIVNKKWERVGERGARGMSKTPRAVIMAVKGSSSNPAKIPAKEYRLKKKSESGKAAMEAEKLADNISFMDRGSFLNRSNNGRKIPLPAAMAAVRVKVKINPASRNCAGFRMRMINPQREIILKISMSR